MEKDKNITNTKQKVSDPALLNVENNKISDSSITLSKLKWLIFIIFIFFLIGGLFIFVILPKNVINKNLNPWTKQNSAEDAIKNNQGKLCGINNDAIPGIGRFELMLEQDQALTCLGRSITEECLPARVELTDNFATSIILYNRKDAEGKCLIGMIDNRTAETEQKIGEAEKYIECPFDIKNIEYLSPASPSKDYANFVMNIYHYLTLEKENGSSACKGTLITSRSAIKPTEISNPDIEKMKIEIEKSGGKLIENNR
ncbi:MAG: hypothetical protein WCV70_03740 [Patescibacteria group bacterium]|jgi:hypothetical protein